MTPGDEPQVGAFLAGRLAKTATRFDLPGGARRRRCRTLIWRYFLAKNIPAQKRFPGALATIAGLCDEIVLLSDALAECRLPAEPVDPEEVEDAA